MVWCTEDVWPLCFSLLSLPPFQPMQSEEGITLGIRKQNQFLMDAIHANGCLRNASKITSF